MTVANDELTAAHNESTASDDQYQQALASVERTIERFKRCTDEERALLTADLKQIQQMHAKLTRAIEAFEALGTSEATN